MKLSNLLFSKVPVEVFEKGLLLQFGKVEYQTSPHTPQIIEGVHMAFYPTAIEWDGTFGTMIIAGYSQVGYKLLSDYCKGSMRNKAAYMLKWVMVNGRSIGFKNSMRALGMICRNLRDKPPSSPKRLRNLFWPLFFMMVSAVSVSQLLTEWVRWVLRHIFH